MYFNKRLLSYLIVLLSLAGSYYAFSGRLIYYIHPRYVLFANSMFIACAIIVCASIAITKKTTKKVHVVPLFIFACFCMLSVIQKPMQLSPQLAQNRTTGKYVATSNPTTYELFTKDFSRFDLQEWSSLLPQYENDDFLIDKISNVEGFAITNNDGTWKIARFVVTCCAVDARPLSIPVMASDIQAIQNGKWYEVGGQIARNKDGKLALKPNYIKIIPQPETPYVY